MEIRFFFPDKYLLPSVTVQGAVPQLNDPVYVRGTKIDSPFNHLVTTAHGATSFIRKWRVLRVDYRIRVGEPVHENHYRAEVHLVPFEEPTSLEEK